MESLDVLSKCEAVAKSIGDKANKNKTRARRLSLALTASTAGVPLSLVIAEAWSAEDDWAFVFGRIVPTLLAAAVAVISRWIQIEQPYQRWVLYRRWHRLFEAEALRYQSRIAPYEGDDRDDKLAERLAQGQIDLDQEWATLIPTSSEIAGEIGTGTS